MMKHENKLKEFSDSIKCDNIHNVGVPKEERERRGQKVYFRK